MEKSYKEILPQIDTFIFDVDGVLTNGMISIMPNGEFVRNMNVKDGFALKLAVSVGYRICIISGGTNNNVKTRLANLGIDDIYLGAHNKIEPFNEFVKKYNLRTENILYMGDDLPDYTVMKLVGMPCSPSDAVREIQQIAKYISNKKGGDGCVRDVIEQVMRVQKKWTVNFDDHFN
ncbi:MAG: KdsC family phosphatase [Tenacibaculum sp.]